MDDVYIYILVEIHFIFFLGTSMSFFNISWRYTSCTCEVRTLKCYAPLHLGHHNVYWPTCVIFLSCLKGWQWNMFMEFKDMYTWFTANMSQHNSVYVAPNPTSTVGSSIYLYVIDMSCVLCMHTLIACFFLAMLVFLMGHQNKQMQ